MDFDKIANLAQEISFAFEDHFHEKNKKELFIAIFDKYLTAVDPGITTDPYDAVIALARRSQEDFENMLRDLRENNLISG
jgi:hypothetical protein